jgi:4-amino-4-deoxy-L-arabinose transferase-like glycosyltransferase
MGAIFLIIAANVLMLLFAVNTLSISYYEADIFYNASGAAHYLVRFSCAVFGQNDYALRVPFIMLHACSTFLLYLLSKSLLKREIDRIISVFIYVMLPGSISAALLVNNAEIIIFFTLLALLFYQREQKEYLYLTLCVSLFLDVGFVVLYFLLFFYSISKKDTLLMVVSLTLFTFGAYMHTEAIIGMSEGKPKGYFLDTFGIYAAIFSPLLFLYFIYAEYRALIKGVRNLLWWLSFGAFIISLLLSFRQRIPVETLAPYLIIAAPFVVGIFLGSYRVRLPKHRRFHKILAGLVVLSLVFNSVFVFANHLLYPFFKKPSEHFAYKYHIAKELANALSELGIKEIVAEDKKLALRLKFYGINEGGEDILTQSLTGGIEIKYANIKVASFEILKKDYGLI